MAHPIPSEALNNHIAFLGSTGSGKTSSCKSAIVEPALAAGERVIILDPTGAWWGLRLTANGRTKAFDIPIFGGRHQDYPLRAQDAELLGETFGGSSGSAIFDTSDMEDDEQLWFSRFVRALFRKNHNPLRMIIDEAHVFMPQAGSRVGGNAPQALHAGNKLVSGGRSRGFRIVLLSQRPAKLHKDALSEVQTLVAMRVVSPQNRDAMGDWMEGQGDKPKVKEIVSTLAGLRPGEAWVWAPEAHYLERVRFKMPDTYDSSKAPQGTGQGPQLQPVNLDDLKLRLATVEAERKANDPKELKAEISRMKAELAKQPTASAPDSTKVYDDAFQKGQSDGFQRGYAVGAEKGRAVLEALREEVTQLGEIFGRSSKLIDLMDWKCPVEIPVKHPTTAEIAHGLAMIEKTRAHLSSKPSAAGQGSSMGRCERAILTVLAQYPQGRRRTQIAILSGYSVTSGGFANSLSKCTSNGWMVSEGDLRKITEEGLRALGSFTPLPTGRELLQKWLNDLGKCEAAILSTLADAWPKSMSRSEVAAATGYSETSGGYANSLSKLRTLELISGSGQLKASDDLF